MRTFALSAAVLALTFRLAAQPAPDDTILKAMGDELARARALKVVSQAQPYYIEYALHDADSISASATLGALIGSNRSRFRLPRIQVRVGDYAFDNTDFLGTDFGGGTRYEIEEFPLDNSYPVLRHHLWLATDMTFKRAVEAYSMKRAALRNVTQNEELADFYHASPVEKITPAQVRPMGQAAWETRVRRLSAVFLDFPVVTRSAVSFEGGQGVQYMVNSEGTRLRIPEGSAVLRIRAGAQAPDGMLLRDALTFHALAADHMAPDAEVERGVKEVAGNLTSLVQAPIGESYSGPVIFEGMAAPQMFAEVLGRNMSPVRRPVLPPGRPFPIASSDLENRIGARILPEWMDVVDDPSAETFAGRPLFGRYDIDLEGVPAARVALVEKGVLKTLLLTRQPARGFSASNGHARLLGSFGAKAVGISNLFVNNTGGVPAAELRKKMLDMCRERNKPYGIIIRKMDFPSSASFEELRRVLAGMAQSGGSAHPVSLPVLVYRVYTDGREELVRGLRLRGFNARSLKDILAASKERFAYDFYDSTAPFAVMGGAAFVSEASAVAPSVLIDDVELERAQDDLPKVPLVPAPALTERASAQQQ